MILSIVTGTYNRSGHLRHMIDSARRNIPHGWRYEFVVVDGGSADGTQAWCKEQPDVRLIEHGELRGAIAAFCDGARAARGDYVLLANDDIVFNPGAIFPAVAHLETHLTCGAVAFADNRPSPGYSDGYKVQVMRAMRDGVAVDVPYAQVGLFRRALGEAAGWWGADDPDFPGHTYGGDNYLSARIWEMGYTVDVVAGCTVNDLVPMDDLRQRNQAVERDNPAAYYKRYPQGPALPNALAAGADERLRVLYMPIYERGYGKYKAGLREALARVGVVYEIDYVNEPYDLPGIVRAWQPHLLLMQAHDANSIRLDSLHQARQICPSMVVVNWNGDVYTRGLTDAAMLDYLRHVDAQLVVNAAALDVYQQHGIPAAYWQVAFEPVDYDALPVMPAHEIVFLGNAYSPARRELGATLKATGRDVGLYGFGWAFEQRNTTYHFAESAALYRSAKIAIGDNQYPNERGFVSNRLFEALASGAFLLHQHVEDMDELTGLRAGTHYVEWGDLDDLQRQIETWLAPRRDARRRRIAEAGRAYVHEHHSFDARVRELWDILEQLYERA